MVWYLVHLKQVFAQWSVLTSPASSFSNSFSPQTQFSYVSCWLPNHSIKETIGSGFSSRQNILSNRHNAFNDCNFGARKVWKTSVVIPIIRQDKRVAAILSHFWSSFQYYRTGLVLFLLTGLNSSHVIVLRRIANLQVMPSRFYPIKSLLAIITEHYCQENTQINTAQVWFDSSLVRESYLPARGWRPDHSSLESSFSLFCFLEPW